MAKSLREQLGKRMRAADGSRQLVFGGPEAEKAFAENQLLQQQLMTQGAPQALADARTEAANLLQQNLDRQQSQQQFERTARQDELSQQGRLALDQQRQADSRDEAIADLRLRNRSQRFNELDRQNQATRLAKQLELQENQYEQRRQDSQFSQNIQIGKSAESLLAEARKMKLSPEGEKELARLSSVYRSISRERGSMRPAQYESLMQDWLNDFEQANLSQYGLQSKPLSERVKEQFERVNIGGRDYEVFVDEDGRLQVNAAREDKDVESTGNYASLQERIANVASDPAVRQKVIESALAQIRARVGDETYNPTVSELQNEMLSVLKSQQAIQTMFDRMQMPVDAPATGIPTPAGAVSSLPDVPDMPKTYDVFFDENGKLQLTPSRNEDEIASPSDGMTQPVRNLNQSSDSGSSGKGALNRASEITDLNMNDYLFGGNEDDNTSSASDAPDYKNLKTAEELETFSADQDFSSILSKLGWKDPKGYRNTKRRLTEQADKDFYRAAKGQSEPISDEQVDELQTIMQEDLPDFIKSPSYKKLQEAVDKNATTDFEFRPDLLFDARHITKMIQAGIDNPLEKLTQGLIESLESGQDHIANSLASGARNQEFLAAPIYPRSSFENKPAEDLPLVWFDEKGMMYRRSPSDKKPKNPYPYPKYGAFRDE